MIRMMCTRRGNRTFTPARVPSGRRLTSFGCGLVRPTDEARGEGQRTGEREGREEGERGGGG